MCHQFSLIEPSTKRRIEQALVRWQAVERMRKDEPEVPDTEAAEFITDTLKDVDNTVITDGSRSIACQIDLTMKDPSDMEANNNSLKAELRIIQEENYPQRSQLEKNSKLLNFYNGFNYFTVFMAVFEFITKGILCILAIINSQTLTAT